MENTETWILCTVFMRITGYTKNLQSIDEKRYIFSYILSRIEWLADDFVNYFARGCKKHTKH